MMRISRPPTHAGEVPGCDADECADHHRDDCGRDAHHERHASAQTMRTQSSRPWWSVPRGCSSDGGANFGWSSSCVTSSM